MGKRAAYLAEQKRVGAMKARIFWLEAVNVNGPEIGQVIKSLKQHHIPDDPTLIAYKAKFVPTKEYRSKQNVSLAPLAVQASWRDGGFTADWTPADFARMRKVWPKMLAIIGRYYREGVLLTTGSDLPNSWVVPGVSLHQEMELLSEAGIPSEAVLAMATRNAASVLGLDHKSELSNPGREPISSSSMRIRSRTYTIPVRSNMCCTTEDFFGQWLCSPKNLVSPRTLHSCLCQSNHLYRSVSLYTAQ